MPRADYSSLTLRTASGCELELLPAAGGISNRLKLWAKGEAYEVIAGLADRQALMEDVAYRGVPLFPVVNRLDGGRYTHEGELYQLPINEPELHNTLHGFLSELLPEVTMHECAAFSTCTLSYHYRGQHPGYPFACEVQFSFVLNNDASLELTMSVTNRHHRPIPFGIGWHPYFCLDRRVDDLSLQLPPVQKLQVNERMLPTGARTEFTEFAHPKPLGRTEFDTCFAIQHDKQNTKATTILWSDSQNVGLELWQQTGEQGLNFLQVCTAPDRRSIAIEPVSCGINALNTGDGLIVLEPHHQLHNRTGVRMITQLPTAA